MKIVIEYDEGDPTSYWAAAKELRQQIERIKDAHLARTYFSGIKSLGWWSDLLDHLDLPKKAGVKSCGSALREDGFTIPNDAVRLVVQYRKSL